MPTQLSHVLNTRKEQGMTRSSRRRGTKSLAIKQAQKPKRELATK